MKKKLFKISFIALISLSFFSCNFASGDDDLLNAPSVTPTENFKVIAVSHEKLSSTNKRVNIERINASQTNAEPVLIATLYPDMDSNPILTYLDHLIYKGKKYKYRFIFIDSDTKKYYTKWSDTVKALDGYSEDTKLSYDNSIGASLLYINENNKLKLSSSIPPLNNELFSDEVSPVLVLKADDISVAFDLTAEILAGTDTFNLLTLPLNFYNKPIYVLGIAAKHKQTPNSSDVIALDWTELVPLNVFYEKAPTEKVKYIKIDQTTSSGTNYN